MEILDPWTISNAYKNKTITITADLICPIDLNNLSKLTLLDF